jgi:hypothetical protein
VIHRINQTDNAPPVYVSTLRDVKYWKELNPGKAAKVDRLSEADARDALNRFTRDFAVLAAALNEIACWQGGEEVDGGFDNPADARRARSALRAAGVVPVGGPPPKE